MSEQYPHKCPVCKYPAYVGIGPASVKCSNVWCKWYEPPKFEYPTESKGPLTGTEAWVGVDSGYHLTGTVRVKLPSPRTYAVITGLDPDPDYTDNDDYDHADDASD